MFDSKVIADTISPLGKRITTLECTYPRFIHSEIMTHRDRGRNSGSSRAIPWPTMCERIENNPVIPIYWGAEQKGMQTSGQIDEPDLAKKIWLEARDNAIDSAKRLAAIGVHKSLCNRLTEPFMWITVVMTATNWRNFFMQRCHQDAEIHFQKIAGMMRESILKSTPKESMYHLPYIQDDDLDTCEPPVLAALENDPFEVLMQVSTARCARVSYVQHGEKAKSIKIDLGLFDRLYKGSAGGHWSPFEHPAMAIDGNSGPYRGWKGYRKLFHSECPEEGYP